MRSFGLVFALTAAAFLPTLFVPAEAATCLSFDLERQQLTQAVEDSTIILVARVESTTQGAAARLQPEAFLQGSSNARPIDLRYPAPAPRCPLASFSTGERVLAFLDGDDGSPEWPGSQQVYHLFDGEAFLVDPGVERRLPEQDLVDTVRAVTGQFAVPAATADEGAGIDWRGTIVPVTAVILVVFVIGLFLMRIWHRIDPS